MNLPGGEFESVNVSRHMPTGPISVHLELGLQTSPQPRLAAPKTFTFNED